MLFTIITKERDSGSSQIELQSDATILAFGDSITYGFGVAEEESYPAQLQKRVGVRVINGGVSGEESSEALERLPKLLEQKPDLVILCHGGNDIIRKRSDEKLKANLTQMIETIKASGAKVLLVGVPNFGILGFNTHSIYAEVAKETEVFFEEDVLSKVLSKNELKIDYIHPNEKGYEIIVDAVVKHLKVIN
ncbi:arylesterase [Sulfurimonas crateris]|uniref:Arylesterase n=2 Tax=Sulfurimonas crateris TaxID=2574727 RepID=A0A4U2Z577_9BACT|nr:arylesterase [Sulfurimonas crateris]